MRRPGERHHRTGDRNSLWINDNAGDFAISNGAGAGGRIRADFAGRSIGGQIEAGRSAARHFRARFNRDSAGFDDDAEGHPVGVRREQDCIDRYRTIRPMAAYHRLRPHVPVRAVRLDHSNAEDIVDDDLIAAGGKNPN